MERTELLEKYHDPIDVLDHGFVRLEDVMGGDADICRAARVSYAGAKSTSDDRSLIRYLLRQEHSSPFEMAEIKLHCKMPIFVARQWIRHRTANVNEVSGRYSVLPDEMYIPDVNVVASQSTTNKQGRGEVGKEGEYEYRFVREVGTHQRILREHYTKLVDAGYARELARINLPLAQYTEWYWKIDLRNLLHFLKLRLDSHAQWEIRQYAQAIANIVKAWVPLSWEAFEDYTLHAVTFSAPEQKLLAKLITSWLHEELPSFEHGLSAREVAEFETKVAAIDINLNAIAGTILEFVKKE